MHRNEAEIPANHDEQEGGYGNADAPGQRLDGPIAPTFVAHQKKESAGETDNGEQQQNQYDDFHCGTCKQTGGVMFGQCR